MTRIQHARDIHNAYIYLLTNVTTTFSKNKFIKSQQYKFMNIYKYIFSNMEQLFNFSHRSIIYLAAMDIYTINCDSI